MSSRDLIYLIGQYKNDPKHADVVARMRAVIDHNPQCTMFLAAKGGKLAPYNYAGQVAAERTVAGDVVVVGAELSSLSTAVQAAERGLHVVVLFAGPLGGMSADTGGNLRYFDVQGSTSHPLGQQKVWHDGLGVKAWVTIPPDTDSLLRAFLVRDYSGRIDLVQTQSYDGLWVVKQGDAIEQIETPEGVAVRAPWFVDSDPESRVAEKAGVPFTLDTPHMSDGMTFDVTNLDSAAYDQLANDDKVHPSGIESLVGVTPRQIADDKTAAGLAKKLRVNINSDFFIVGATHSYGYCGLAMGFGFYMACRELKDPSPDLAWLNGRRFVSGFNISKFGADASFNSISYRFMKNWLQHSHSLTTDPTFAPIVRTEIPALQSYLRYVTGSPDLTVRMPPQFYVRSPSAFFKLLHPYTAAEFNGPKTGPYFTHYPMDLRDLFPRDQASWTAVMKYVKEAKGKHFWNARASAAETTISNLFLVNKCGVTPAFSGGQRTEQSAVNLGAAVADELASRKGTTPVPVAAKRL
ncbi:MAG: FAD-dependent oxidoreductase [Fimbriimonadaceae bacterium]